MPAIDVQQLTKIYPVAIKQPGLSGTLRHFFQRDYRQVKAVNDVSFSIEPGEVVGFLGPNGAGKTTTLKMLTGLIYPSSGHVRVAGHIPFQRQRTFLEQITLVMGQKQQLIWDLPTLDSLRINGAIYNLSTQTLRQRIYELAEMLDIEDKLTQPVRKLSLGERMKAEMLAALLHRPKVLFLDEPTLGLDVNAQMAVRKFLQTYNQHYQATIVLTSHYMADITALCDRVLLIYQGQMIYDGSLDSLVAQFSPYREVTADLSAEVSAEVLGTYGEIQSIEGCKVVLLVRREDLTKNVSLALA
ncbi:MAG: ATP-binding cassette domain-containing protein, partial [Cyanobacteria bacterium J06642_11]